LYYIYYLKHKSETEYTGIESEIFEKIDSNDFSWFPDHEAIGVPKKQDFVEKNQQQEMLESLNLFILKSRDW
jgi:hypothetical protein